MVVLARHTVLYHIFKNNKLKLDTADESRISLLLLEVRYRCFAVYIIQAAMDELLLQSTI